MTAPQIEEALHRAPPHERIALAARLFALALAEDDLDTPAERMPEDRDQLIARILEKRAARP